MFTHKVIRTFPSQEVLYPGKLVDASNWLNTKLLEEHGYIEPLSQPEAEAPAVEAQEPASPAVAEGESAPAGESAPPAVAERTPSAEGRRTRRRQG